MARSLPFVLIVLTLTLACSAAPQVTPQTEPKGRDATEAQHPPSKAEAEVPAPIPLETISPALLAELEEVERQQYATLVGPLLDGQVFRAVGEDGAHVIVVYAWGSSPQLVGLAPNS